jgi:hypothetical protein
VDLPAICLARVRVADDSNGQTVKSRRFFFKEAGKDFHGHTIHTTGG